MDERREGLRRGLSRSRRRGLRRESEPINVNGSVVARYEANYGLPSGSVSAEQVRSHLELERRLTRELLASLPVQRWETFERCYDELYVQLPWLVGAGGPADTEHWKRLIGRAPQRIYEIGSGAGEFARALALAGHNVEATDVSRHRGGTREESMNLTWSITDGVNLQQFATRGPYDVVLSDQVLEHLHPEDVLTHCRSCRDVLHTGGRYILRTPNRLTGPHDVSRVFGLNEPVGMHLHEYTVTELRTILREAGFSKVHSVLSLPSWTRPNIAHTRLQMLVEALISRANRRRRQRISRYLRGPLHPDVWLVALR
jgi:2-polyprenyl-3-methyl-5-hydroxy-6-metoxy-1,4-benzoquinol methylase